MIEQLLGRIEELTILEKTCWAKIGEEMYKMNQYNSRKDELKHLVEQEQARQEQERQKAQNEPTPAV